MSSQSRHHLLCVCLLMSPRGFQRLPPFAVVAGPFLGLLVLVLLWFAPLEYWVDRAWPRASAEYHLSHAQQVLVFSSCPDDLADYWLRLRQMSDGSGSFEFVLRDADGPNGIVLGLAGLSRVDPVRFLTLRDSITESHHDSIKVLIGGSADQESLVPIGVMLRPPMLDSLLHHLERPRPSFEC